MLPMLGDALSDRSRATYFRSTVQPAIRATSTMRWIGAWLVLSLLILVGLCDQAASGSSRGEVRDLLNDESSRANRLEALRARLHGVDDSDRDRTLFGRRYSTE